ncbi:ABC transporter permease [Paenibacillus sp. LHD-117]|uniref:YhgE/Pip domain-containing protein n=1 Tax=Paenibacillus sp. LHD-117 TaxID=3071412 RepID=UPI0027E1186F|nr:ABC transporter permease [Paenibacillus sp. LHD-117]MDQ6420108.1 ABC transporter permease [Paenibacillus sp. LHD-117]
MNTALKAFMKRPTTWVGIITAFMFQIIFSVIWMTGYEGVTDRVDQLRIAVVNEDATGMGATISANLAEKLPFEIVQPSSLEEAKRQLDDRELQMVVHIPAEFAQQAATPEAQAKIGYLINESNPALIKSMMSGAAETITAEVNKQAVAMGIQQTLVGLKLPGEQAAAASSGLSERVVSDIQSVNAVQGMNNQMVPMMMVLASYVGAMIMGMNIEQSSMAIGAATSRWGRFGARSLINIVSAAAVSLVGASLLAALGGQIEQGFLQLWGFQFLFLLTFMFVSQMFLYLFGMAGMLFNIMLLSVQLVSSGAMVPRELLSDFYTGLSKLLPATYAVDGNMNILFGGPGVGGDVTALLSIGAIAIVVSAAAVLLKTKAIRQPQVSIASQNQK